MNRRISQLPSAMLRFKRGLFFLCLSFLPALTANAQLSRFLVEFKDKNGTPGSLADPARYLSQRSLDRRLRYSLKVDSTDLPVSALYLQQVRAIPGVNILNVSYWLNAVSVEAADQSAIDAIQALNAVRSVRAVAAKGRASRSSGTIDASRPAGTSDASWRGETMPAPWPVTKPDVLPLNHTGTAFTNRHQEEPLNYGAASFNEIHLHNGEFLHNIGLRGQDRMITLLDGGFFRYDILPAFDSVNQNNQVISTWDFVAREASVAEDNNHGMQCFSTISANIPGVFIGTAPKALFNLFRTEDAATEYPIEEFNWACAAQRADSLGTDLISSSLGYAYGWSGGIPDYPFSDLNGDITVSARAADLAAARGILVVNSAGNSGNDYWKRIVTPADADSVLAVGAVDLSGMPGSFSSYGPSADGRVKPDVASVGVSALIQNTAGGVLPANGTSYSGPKMAGLAACLWQAFPDVNNMRILRALRESGNRYGDPDDRVGYGIPDLKKAFNTLLKEYASVRFSVNEQCQLTLTGRSRITSAMRYELLRFADTDSGFTRVAVFVPDSAMINLSTHSFDFTRTVRDEKPGPVRYRLMQVTDTAAATLTRVQIGEDTLIDQPGCLLNGQYPSIMLSPNPSTGATSLVFTTEDLINRFSIAVFDLQGKRLLTLTGTKPAGLYRQPLDLSGLAAGTYLIQVLEGYRKLASLQFLKR